MMENEVTREIIGAAIEVHRELGPGEEEAVYERCLCHELKLRNIRFVSQHPLPIVYKGIKLDCGYRMDAEVENTVVIENKTVEAVLPVHEAQLLTYMKLRRRKLGLLLNFNVPLLKQGVFRKVLGFDGYLPAAKRICSRPPAGLPLSSINPAQDALSATVIGSAMEVHRELGPGLLASAYTACMQHELHLRNIAFESRNLAQIEFKGLTIESAANLDMIVDRKLALKIKSIDCATELHCAQLRAQMRRHGCSVGLLINFNHLMLIQGVHRFVC